MLALFAGLNCSIRPRMSRASLGVSLPNHSFTGLIRIEETLSIIVWAVSEPREWMSYRLGFPVKLSTLSSWLRVDEPGNKGFPRRSSPKMHPMLQMSAAFEQVWDPSRTQGALYHRVATSSVRTRSSAKSWERLLARPKSHILREQSELMRRLEGFRSLWMSSVEWRYCMPRRTWARRWRWWTSLSIFWEMALWRSASMNSQTRQRSLSLSARTTLSSFMMLGCDSSWRQQIYRQVRWASTECWKASKIFFRARGWGGRDWWVWDARRSMTFQTCPQAPEPIFLRRLQRERMWGSTYSAMETRGRQRFKFDFRTCFIKFRHRSSPSNYTRMVFLPVILLALCLALSSSRFPPTAPSLSMVTFTAYYPDIHIGPSSLSMRGDHCKLNWTKGVPLKRTANDTWSTALLCEEGVLIQVKLLLNDSSWMFGKNAVFSTDAGKTVSLYPSFKPTANAVEDTAPVSSAILGNSRKCSIYYPPSFFDNSLKKYEVLLMHDGQNLFDPKKAAFGTAWLIQNTLNTLMAEGKMREIVVVGVWNTNDRNNQYTYSYDPNEKFGGKGDKYLDFIEKELLPVVEGSWLKGRVEKSEGYSMGGSSLGGLISCYAGYKRPAVFSKSICMSSSFWWNSRDFDSAVLSAGKPSESVSVYLDSGDSGPSQDSKNDTIAVGNHLEKLGYVMNSSLFYYLDKGGQHSEAYWGKRFYLPMQYLFP